MKIAFMGISGSGKDFLANYYLISNYGFIRLSFKMINQKNWPIIFILGWKRITQSENKNVTTQYNLYLPETLSAIHQEIYG